MAAGRRIRILIVDDSAVMRSLLRSVVATDPGLEVAGTAADGESALSAIASLRPDVVLLDVEMPVMDGLATLRKLRVQGHKTQVIMCSSLTRRGAKVTIEALACGASDYVAKPAGQSGREAAILALSQDLIPKILALTSHPEPVIAGPPRSLLIAPMAPFPKAPPISSVPVALAMGVSTGGPAALDILLPALPASFPLPVLIVQHMPELFTRLFAERLNGRCPLEVHEAVEGEPVRAGAIYIAKGNWHMEAIAGARIGSPPTLHLNQGALENHCRPAVDVLFRSVAAVYGAGALAVVLTGMGSDGMLGCRIIRDHGGSVLAQDQATSTVWGMPGAVASSGLANRILPLGAIAPEILRLASRTHSEARELRESVVQ
ncbi:MAG: chemotaxis response regulator protein-glutamate methylesterase [Terracidiphilus sp.]|jgi:two-component system chemotaxis response regulator CheB